jgi:imidazolonepropionase-like amidohydrolase
MQVLVHGLAVFATVGLVAPGFARPVVQDSASDDAGAETIFIRAERVIVRPGEVLEDAGVLVVDGTIRAVGQGVSAPEGAQMLEASVVCAGFFDAWATVGLSADVVRDGSTTAASRTSDGIDPQARAHVLQEALRAGVTVARVQGGAAAKTSGIGAVLRLDPEGSRGEALVVADANVAMNVGMTVLGGAPAVQLVGLAHSARPMDPFDRVAEVDRVIGALDAGWKYVLDEAKYDADLEEWEKAIVEKEEELEKDFKKAKKSRDKKQKDAEEKGKEFKESKYKEDRKPKLPKYDENKEVMGRVANGELPLVVQAHRWNELRELLEGTARFDRLRLIVAGGTEALAHAEELAARNIPVLLWPAPLGADARPDEYESHDLALAGNLAEAGVSVLIGSGGYKAEASRDLPLLASLAIGHGLDREKAFEALTVGAARAFDVADRVGTVERGKDADLLLLSGEPLLATTRVLFVIAGGRVVVTPED